MRANLFKCKFARISVHFMLDPVQPLECETGLLGTTRILLSQAIALITAEHVGKAAFACRRG